MNPCDHDFERDGACQKCGAQLYDVWMATVIEAAHAEALLSEAQSLEGLRLVMELQTAAQIAVAEDTIHTLAFSVAHERGAHMDALHDHALTWELLFRSMDREQALLDREAKRLGFTT